MIVLAFDTATAATVVALRSGPDVTVQARDDPAPGQRPNHVTRLLVLIENLLADAGLAWAQVGRIVVGTGPGTFTGLRIGITTARALAQSTGAELAGVSTLETLAAATSGELGAPRRVLAVLDARRGEAFAAAYLVDRAPAGREPRAPSPLGVPQAVAPERLTDLLGTPADGGEPVDRHPERASGGGSGSPALADTSAAREHGGQLPWLAVGDGAIRFREHLESAQVAVPRAESPLHRVDARVLCRLGAETPRVEPFKLAPEYLRVPDADLNPLPPLR